MDYSRRSGCFDQEDWFLSRINLRYVWKNGRHPTELDLYFPYQRHVESNLKDKRRIL